MAASEGVWNAETFPNPFSVCILPAEDGNCHDVEFLKPIAEKKLTWVIFFVQFCRLFGRNYLFF